MKSARSLNAPADLAGCRFSVGCLKRPTAPRGWCAARTLHVAPALAAFRLNRQAARVGGATTAVPTAASQNGPKAQPFTQRRVTPWVSEEPSCRAHRRMGQRFFWVKGWPVGPHGTCWPTLRQVPGLKAGRAVGLRPAEDLRPTEQKRHREIRLFAHEFLRGQAGTSRACRQNAPLAGIIHRAGHQPETQVRDRQSLTLLARWAHCFAILPRTWCLE